MSRSLIGNRVEAAIKIHYTGRVIKKDRLLTQNGHSKQKIYSRNVGKHALLKISAKRNRRGVAVGDSAGDASSPVDGSLASSPCKTDWSPHLRPGVLEERNAPEGCIIAPSHP